MTNSNEAKKSHNRIAPVNGEHPAYGTIRVTRVHGDHDLFQSCIKTGDCVRLEITEAKEKVSADGATSVDAGNNLISIEMSFAQFSAMLLSVGLYAGTPCTITRIGGAVQDREPGRVPGIAVGEEDGFEVAADRFKKKLEETVKEGVEVLEAACADLEASVESGEGKKVMRESLVNLRAGIRVIAANASYMGRTFSEQAKKTVESARMEITAHASGMASAYRLSALQANREALAALDHEDRPDTAPTLMIPDGK